MTSEQVLAMAETVDDIRLADDEDFPSADSQAAQGLFLLNYACLAPSGHNTQPWLFRVNGARIDVFADRRRALPVVDPLDRELSMSCAAAVGTLEVAARFFGVDTRVTWLPQPTDHDHLASVTCVPGAGPSDDDVRRFRAIKQRRTNRQAFRNETVPQALLDRCAEIAATYSVSLTAAGDPASKSAVAALVAEGDREQFADPRFRRELASWVHSTRLGSRDGMSGASFGMPDILSGVGALAIRTFDIGNGIAADDREKIQFGSPALGLFSSSTDDTQSWLDTGRALAHVLLELTAEGYTSSYLNQPVETESLRTRLADALDAKWIPQLLLRIGRAAPSPTTVRRPLADVLVG